MNEAFRLMAMISSKEDDHFLRHAILASYRSAEQNLIHMVVDISEVISPQCQQGWHRIGA